MSAAQDEAAVRAPFESAVLTAAHRAIRNHDFVVMQAADPRQPALEPVADLGALGVDYQDMRHQFPPPPRIAKG